MKFPIASTIHLEWDNVHIEISWSILKYIGLIFVWFQMHHSRLWYNFQCAANSNMVEVVLLGLSSVLDTLWPCDIPSGWQDYSNRGTWTRPCDSEILPKIPHGLWLWLPWSSCRGPYWLCPHFLLCFCLWHQVPQLPKEIRKRKNLQECQDFAWVIDRAERERWFCLVFSTKFVKL